MDFLPFEQFFFGLGGGRGTFFKICHFLCKRILGLLLRSNNNWQNRFWMDSHLKLDFFWSWGGVGGEIFKNDENLGKKHSSGAKHALGVEIFKKIYFFDISLIFRVLWFFSDFFNFFSTFSTIFDFFRFFRFSFPL